MTKLTLEQWATIRGEREAGESFGELAKRHGVSKAAIVQRSTAEGWSDGAEGRAEVRRLARERAGMTDPATAAEAKTAAIDRQADAGAAVIRKHQSEWSEHRRRFPLEALAQDFEHGKRAKICAEMLAIRQNGERKAYVLDAEAAQSVVIDRGAAVQVYLPDNGRARIDYSKISTDALEQITAAVVQ
ncbi:MAG: hypothetical protein MUE46_11145 [Xanthomonadales bacterium]|jgi:hypothetical protein|nr:hypothetical protein [Xanthomonadales bacterium]